MKKHVYYQRETVPTVFVTKGRQRVKQYDNYIVYLENGEEFELELFNPTNQKVLAKISLNGESLGSGIVLRPGERVFLERYLNETKKFLFETYEVDANDSNVQKAIKDNGIVEVEFYKEYKEPYTIVYNDLNHWDSWPHRWTYTGPAPVYYYSKGANTVDPGQCIGGANSYYCNTSTSDIHLTGSANIGSIRNGDVCNSMEDVAMSMSCSTPINESKVVETGRVEKGSYSDQSFVYDSTSFQSYCTWKCAWKILPKSQKALVKEDLKVFCVNCCRRRKKDSHAFCPNCGTKF